MIRFYRYETELCALMPEVRPLFRTLIGSAESINDAIEKAIEALPPGQKVVFIKATGTAGGDVHFAAGMKFYKDWQVTLGLDFPKGEAAGWHIETVIPL